MYHHETPSPFTAYGVKGGGEGGRMVAPAAVTSAVEDALKPFGVKIAETALHNCLSVGNMLSWEVVGM